MALSGRAHAAVPVVISGLVLVVAQLHGHLEVVLPVVPLLLLVASLLFGLYPGCDAVVRLSERLASRPRVSARSAHRDRRPRLPFAPAAHGGLLLAFSLSGRAPPA